MAINRRHPGITKRHGERGFSLVEILVVVAIASALIVGSVVAFNHQGYERAGSSKLFGSMIDRAESVAHSSGNGATVVYFSNTDAGVKAPAGSYILVICAGRPDAAGLSSCIVEPSTPGSVSVSPPGGTAVTGDWAVYVDSSGSVATGPWTTSYANTVAANATPIASEPSCPAGSSIGVTFSGGEASSTGTIDCSTGAFAYQ
jgi:prepilin-type N-terminal cleavage/methylation domain-containing protein